MDKRKQDTQKLASDFFKKQVAEKWWKNDFFSISTRIKTQQKIHKSKEALQLEHQKLGDDVLGIQNMPEALMELKSCNYFNGTP